MTDREAQELVRAIEHLWDYDMGSDARQTWCEGLATMHSLHASEAVLRLHQRQPEKPTLPDVRNMIAKVVRDHEHPKRNELPPAGAEAPLWVRRWLCARYLFAKFDREQDMRRFREQDQWAHPSLEVMPDGEWEEQALLISDWEHELAKVLGGTR